MAWRCFDFALLVVPYPGPARTLIDCVNTSGRSRNQPSGPVHVRTHIKVPVPSAQVPNPNGRPASLDNTKMSSSSEQADETVALARPGSNGSDSAARKRKRSEEGVALSEKVKKQKRNQQERKRKRLQSVRDEYLDGNLNVDKSYAHMSNGLLADQIGQRARQFGGELSAVELDDMRVPGPS